MTTITLNPSASNHDASQDGSGVVTLTGEIKATAGTHWAGLLLPGVTVPVGATINSATLYYKPYSTARDDPGFNWYAEAADNASVFTTTGSSISSRSRTTAVTGDTATNIGTGSYRTVDVTAQVDEVTTRAGWASGNNIVLIADATAAADIWILSYDSGSGIWYVEIDYTAGVFTRTVSASGDDGAESTGGSMTLTTTTMDVDGVGDIMGFMFRGVQVPTGSSITTAYLKVYTNDSGRDSPNVTIKAQYNPAAFGTGSTNFSSRTMTTASASWVATDIGIGAYKNSPSLTAVLQEVVDNGGWTGAGDVAFFLIQNSSSGWLRVASWDHATDPPPQLYVEWSDALTPIEGEGASTLGAVTGSAAAVLPGHGTAASTLGAVTTSGAAALTVSGAGAATLGAVTGAAAGVLPIKGAAGAAVGSFSLDIAAGGDDGYESADGTVNTSAAWLDLYGGATGGLLFRNVAIPAGATVTSAYLNVRPYSTGADSPNLTIRGEYDPATFTTADYNLSDRTKTTANVVWNAANIGADDYKPSPDISGVIQEIVDTVGWGGGDNLALYLIDNDAGGGLAIATLEYSPTYPPPQLVVEWSLPATSNEIDAVTGSGAATLATHGAADVTLGAITGAAVGGVISGASGAATLDAITGTAAATLLTHADADATLGAATSSGAGALAIVGAGSATLDAATTSGAGVLPLLGAADATLGAVTSSGAAVLTIVGAGAAALGDVTTAGQGELGLEVGAGAGNVTLGATTGTATAMLLIVGAGASTLDAVTTEGAGALLVAATGAASLEATTTSGAGRVSIAASGAAALGAVTTEAASLLPIGAGGDVATGDIVSTASGKLAIVGTAAVTLDTITGAAAGLLNLAGAGAATLDATTASGAAVLVTHGAGAATLGAITGAAASLLATHGAGAASVTIVTSGAGAVAIRGAAAVALGAVTGEGAGVSTVVTLGAGDATLAPITGVATSVLATHGEGDAAITIIGAAVGRVLMLGSGAATLDDVGTSGAGVLPIRATGAAALTIEGAAVAALVITGAGAASVTIVGAATGGMVMYGVGAATLGAITGEAVAHAALVSVFIGSVTSPGKTGRVLYPTPRGSVRTAGNLRES
jgi:hypothetical protein